MLVELYENNVVIKTVVNIIGDILKGIWQGIINFFSGLGNKT